MDQKLYMTDILDLICVHIGPMDYYSFSDRKEIRRDLAALAKTCKTFQDPALDALWRFQYSLFPALRCFPDDLWERSFETKAVMAKAVKGLPATKAVKAKDTFVEFRRPLRPTDWDRPMFYWRRIKSFRIDAINMARISLNVCKTLQIGSPSGTPFPNLREICWFDGNPAHFPVFEMFLSPRLSSIGLDLEATDFLFLPTLGDRYPDLTRVELQGNLESDSLESTLALLSKLNRLEWVWIPQADAAILERLAQIPTLKTLVVYTIIPFESFPERDRTTPRFSSLEILELLDEPTMSITLVDAIQHGKLVRLSLAFSNTPDSPTTTRLYTAIASTSSYSTLEILNIRASDREEPPKDEFDNYVVRAKTLRILFPFTHLTNINLELIYGFELDDEVVSEMARAWCRVEGLRLGCTSGLHDISGGPTRVTMVGIQAIATHCSDLGSLALAFDASTVPQLDYYTFLQTTLTSFNVFSSPISSPALVAAALSAMFPNLGRVSGGCRYYDPDKELIPPLVRRWKMVDSIIRDENPSDSDEKEEEEECITADESSTLD
ncbi:hypothetical protein MVEN_02272700 [Mycena venus]|uniref:F-box domain-containing protein n=1 Tax=Mycena venus TaxID=2733690 RepID=A0A8H6X4Y4_9AGAR|nr:hypothetical protein MVEN_02272700 [Mycena venus]